MILGVGVALAASALGLFAERARRRRAASADRASRPPTRPPSVPIGPFDVNSTAEQVTSGIDLSGKTILITGVTSGIGLETMRFLAKRGAHVGRTLDRARAACASVGGSTPPLMLELTDYSSAVACAAAARNGATCTTTSSS